MLSYDRSYSRRAYTSTRYIIVLFDIRYGPVPICCPQMRRARARVVRALTYRYRAHIWTFFHGRESHTNTFHPPSAFTHRHIAFGGNSARPHTLSPFRYLEARVSEQVLFHLVNKFRIVFSGELLLLTDSRTRHAAPRM